MLLPEVSRKRWTELGDSAVYGWRRVPWGSLRSAAGKPRSPTLPSCAIRIPKIGTEIGTGRMNIGRERT